MADDGRLGEVRNLAVRNERGCGDGLCDGSEPRAENDADCRTKRGKPGLKICGGLRDLIEVGNGRYTGGLLSILQASGGARAAYDLTTDSVESTRRLGLPGGFPRG